MLLLLFVLFSRESSPAQGQQLQLEQTSDATSSLRLCCRASASGIGQGILEVASRVPFPEMKTESVVVAGCFLKNLGVLGEHFKNNLEMFRTLARPRLYR